MRTVKVKCDICGLTIIPSQSTAKMTARQVMAVGKKHHDLCFTCMRVVYYLADNQIVPETALIQPFTKRYLT